MATQETNLFIWGLFTVPGVLVSWVLGLDLEKLKLM